MCSNITILFFSELDFKSVLVRCGDWDIKNVSKEVEFWEYQELPLKMIVTHPRKDPSYLLCWIIDLTWSVPRGNMGFLRPAKPHFFTMWPLMTFEFGTPGPALLLSKNFLLYLRFSGFESDILTNDIAILYTEGEFKRVSNEWTSF